MLARRCASRLSEGMVTSESKSSAAGSTWRLDERMCWRRLLTAYFLLRKCA